MPPKRHVKRKSDRQPETKKAPRNASAAAGAPRKIAMPNVDTNGDRLPAPVAVLLSMIAPAPSTAALTSSPSPPSPHALVEVEVETKQGYVLKGVLAGLDAFYNVTLQDATSRRARACDVERALMRDKLERAARGFNDPFFPGGGHAGALDEATEMLMEEYRERPDSRARPRFVGTTLVRSSNLVMIRFLPNALAATSTATTTAAATTAATPGASLSQRFSAMAAGIKKALALQKLQNRRERRQRLEEAKKKRQES